MISGAHCGDPIAWVPGDETLLQLVEEHARRTAEAADEGELARLVCASVGSGTGASGASVFDAAGSGWRLLCGVGEGAPRILAAAAQEEELRAQGIAILASLGAEGGGRRLLAVAGARGGRAFTADERRFVGAVAAQAELAFRRAALCRRLRELESPEVDASDAVSVAHDLVKPLGVVERLGSSLARQLPATEPGQRDLATIVELAREMRGMLRGLLDRSTVAARPVALDSALQRAIRAVERLCGCYRVVLRTPVALPLAEGDETGLVRALVNVLENAILASPEGGFVELRVGYEGVESGWLAVDVVDRGCGMPPAVRERAFEPFFGARGGGRGLGLAIARDLVESMGGRIEIGSHPGSGTRVRVVLRRVSAEG